MLAPNTLLQNRYLVLGAIGEGGMGAVYIVTDQRLRCTVALKETFFTEDSLRRAFEREAQLLASLRHPALPNVTDHFMEEGGQYLVMQFIPGEDLEDIVRREGRPLLPDQVLDWADQLLDVLDYLHTQQHPIIHRDIKPKNLKLAGRSQIVLLDFGLAKGAAGQMQTSAANKSLLGYTPGYAPLEQVVRADQRWIDVLTITSAAQLERVQEQSTDARSDLYSLGTTLYRLLTGLIPKDAPTRALSVWSGRPDPLLSLYETGANVSPAVAEVLMRVMAIDRDQRFASANEMRAALRAALRASNSHGGAGVASGYEASEEPTVIDAEVSVECYSKTDVGRVRAKNADNFLVLSLPAGKAWTASDGGDMPGALRHLRLGAGHLVLAVADGADDMPAAAIASRMAVETVRDMLAGDEDDEEDFLLTTPLIECLRNALDYANFGIHRKSLENPRCSGMKASITAAALSYDILDIVQVGNTRAYVIRGDHIKLVTKDQTHIQQFVDSGQITWQEAEADIRRDALFQALGAQPEITPVSSRVKLQRGDVVLLCSRGLWRKLRPEDMMRIVAACEFDPALAIPMLLEEANLRGGAENITAQMVVLKEGMYSPDSKITVELPALM